jgi:bacterioferritin
MNNNALIKRLNAQFNREVGTLARYLIEAAILNDTDHESARHMYLRDVSEKLEHAQYIADQIVALGGTPSLKSARFSPPTNVREMLRHDANEEQKDEKNYSRLASEAEKARLSPLKLRMQDQAAAEHQHVNAMEGLLW